MRTIMLGYWVILAGLVLDIVGTIWDMIDDVTGEEALGGVLTPEILQFLGVVVIILGLVLGFRLGLRRRS
jgi:nucleoside recognition membrane protein YjiH